MSKVHRTLLPMKKMVLQMVLQINQEEGTSSSPISNFLSHGCMYVIETAHDDNLKIGLWIIGGIFTFLVLEKIFQDEETEDETNEVGKHLFLLIAQSYPCPLVFLHFYLIKPKTEDTDTHVCNGSSTVVNGYSKHEDLNVRKRTKENSKKDHKECSHKEHHASPKEKEIKV